MSTISALAHLTYQSESKMTKSQESRLKKPMLEANCCISLNSSASTIREGDVDAVGDGHNNNLQDLSLVKRFTREQSFSTKTSVAIQFQNIIYTVKSWSLRKFTVRKEILRGINGEFLPGQLTAIMGPSGAGKSTLLNVLAGYVTSGLSGQVLVNNQPRKRMELSRLACYIQQDDLLRSFLTAEELMMSTSHLKLGSTKSKQQKQEQVSEILCTLGLHECRNTRCCLLSGGQQKRLSIALELISNPPVLFLDEPTTGLDSSSCSQCISLLKMLAMEGRTIICTIHQPSALLFEMFDHLYALSAGLCVYQGPTKSLLPYLEKFGLECPNYHNPADFLMDVCMGEYGADPEKLAKEASTLSPTNISYGRNTMANNLEMKIIHNGEKMHIDLTNKHSYEQHSFQNNTLTARKRFREGRLKVPASSLVAQFWLLLCRNIISMARDSSRLLLRLGAHVAIGVIFGYLYRGVGDNALTVLGNCVFLYGTLLFLVYTGKMAVTLSFPMEFKMLRREHFNRWYSLGPYFLSLISIEIPVQIMCVSLYLGIAYPLTGQPMDFNRFMHTYCLCLIASLTAQSFGFLIGITTPVKIAVFIGPVIAVVFSMFGFNIFYRDIPIGFRWLFHLSYFRAAYQGTLFSIYNNRTTLPCPERVYYCHFKSSTKFLQDMDTIDIDVTQNVMFIVGWCLCLYVLTFISVWWRLNRR